MEREGRRRELSPARLVPDTDKERSKEPNLLELQPYLSRRPTREELGAWAWSGVGL